ncbi:hypothetical protein D3C72_2383680 [compost metagenome]
MHQQQKLAIVDAVNLKQFVHEIQIFIGRIKHAAGLDEITKPIIRLVAADASGYALFYVI